MRELGSVTVYNLATSSFFLNSTRFTLGGFDEELRKNADGTVDIYFGPKAPVGQESNWLYTAAGQKWFPRLRLYGPERAVLDKSFKLPDIKRIN